MATLGNPLADPVADVQLALKLLDIGLQWLNRLKAQGGMTTDQIIAHADSQDLANLDAIKALLAS